MGLRCSLLGHDFGETEVERERDEQGSEVVVTVREYQECTRCSERRVVTESTEVTSTTPESIDAEFDGPEATAVDTQGADPVGDVSGSDPTVEAESKPEHAGNLETTSAEVIDDGDDTEQGATLETPPSDGDATDDDSIPTDENGEPITDDAEILEDEPDSPTDREHGEWPKSDDVGPPVAEAEPSTWPDADAAQESGERVNPASSTTADATGSAGEDDDAVFVDADTDTVGRGDSGVEDDAESGTGIASAQSAPAPGEAVVRGGDPTEFFCPECSFVAPEDRASLRVGDICPECRNGYLGERDRR
ncbi:DUF7093 family protein [Natrialbaceae archaeon AArc-T1-2]|uniref:DUF7093 family protein n=1 Tax=Natrialbaceae archaeon AArc-T1-2 TaxID=3053904 RepID=UPI00255A94D9|nr:hypothetical protein [Natrialbaceae archaeon AArc-T1-2]WIV66284.1 hypothetical protein QQ977_11345 [Natrialbaceae archaeon AArc-T1-2]